MNTSQRTATLYPSILTVAMMILCALNSHAGIDTWIGNNGGNWSNTNNWSPVTLAGPVANDQLSFISAGVAGTLLNDDLASGMMLNGLTFQSGSSAFTIYGNAIGLNGGITNSGASSQVISNNLVLHANGTINAAAPVTLAGAVNGAFNLAKVGSGTLTLAGSGNTYSGPTLVNAGTLRVAATGALPPTNVVFTGASAATLDIQGNSQALANMIFTNIGTSAITIVGTNGILNVSPVSLSISPLATTNSLTLNMSGLGTFVYSNAAGTFSAVNGVVAVTSSTGQCTTTLAATNSITAASIGVGTAPTSGGTVASTLNLGASNQLTAATITLGNGRAGGTIQFASGLTAPAVTIAGTNGGCGLATLSLGSHDSFQVSDSPVDLIDVSAGTVNAQFAGVTIGRTAPSANMTANRFITSTSTFKMGAGTLTASNVTLGVINSAVGDTGSFSYSITNNSVFSITNRGTAIITNLVLANNNYAGNLTASSKLSALVILTNGATLETASIQKGNIASPNSGTLNVISQIIWGDGTISNTPGANVSIDGVDVVLAGASTAHKFNIGSGQTATVSSVISGAGSLTMVGPGTVTLSGASIYSGSTVISNGTLSITGSGSIASPIINVFTNAVFDVSTVSGGFSLGASQTLIGNGGINGDVNAVAGAKITPGGSGAAGTLTFSNNLILNGQSLNFDLGSNPTAGNDLVDIGNTLTLNANTTIQINELAGPLAAGTYTLMNYAALNANGFNFTLIAPRGAALNAGPNALSLTVSGVSADNLTWVGDNAANNWDIETTANWSNGGTADYFYQNDSVTFDDTGSASPSINLTTALYPGNVNVNAAQNYTFSGAGQLAGSMTLTKNGTGTLYLQQTNTYTSGTIVNNGTLELDTPNGAGAGAIGLGAGVLSINFGAGTLPNALAGTGIVNVVESGGLTTSFGGSLSNFTGTINIPNSGGTTAKTAINSTAVNISSNATINIANGGTLYLAGVVMAATNNVSGSGNSENLGALRIDGGSTVSGPVNLLGNTTIGAFSSGSGTISGVISDGGNGYGITKIGGNASTLILAGTNTYSGGTIISNGTIQVGNGTSNGVLPGDVNIASNNAVLSFIATSNTTVAYNGTISGSGSLAVGSIAGLGLGGTLVLNGMNTFTNGVNINAGALWITNAAALGMGPKTITANNGSTGHPELHLNGISGSVVLPATMPFLTSWNNGVIFNEAGTNEIDGNVTLTTGGGGTYIVANAGQLMLGGNIAPNSSGRTFQVGGNGNGIVTGIIADGSGANVLAGVSKTGAGTWTFAGANTYAANTTVSAGTLLINGSVGSGGATVQTNAVLGGSGAISGTTTVQDGGILQAGNAGGSNVLTTATLALGNGSSTTTFSRFIVAAGGEIAATTLNISGTNIIQIMDSNLVAGTNTLFTYTGSIGGSSGFAGFKLGALPSGVTASLLDTGSSVQLAVTSISSVNLNPPQLLDSISGNTLTLSWPADHLGWRLLVQTNPATTGLGTNWFTWPNSTNATTASITVNPANPAVFFRLVHP